MQQPPAAVDALTSTLAELPSLQVALNGRLPKIPLKTSRPPRLLLMESMMPLTGRHVKSISAQAELRFNRWLADAWTASACTLLSDAFSTAAKFRTWPALAASSQRRK